MEVLLNKMLWKRVISGIFGIIFLYFIISWGSLPFFLLTVFLCGMGACEFNKLLPVQDRFHFLLPGGAIVLLSTLYFLEGESLAAGFGAVILISLLVFYFVQIKFFSYEDFVIRVGGKLLGIIYLGGGSFFLILLRDYSGAGFKETAVLWLVLLATWSSDTGAYFAGNAFGKHQLAPDISPNKTVAGGVGGIVLAVIVVFVFLLFLDIYSPLWFIFAPVISLTAMLGDLFISCLKRDAGVKDAGNIIPGHGGILDRFDSLLFSAPVAYYLIHLFM